jgi:surface protein
MSCIEKISGKTLINGDYINGKRAQDAEYVDDVPFCFEFSFRLDTTLGDGSNDFSIPLSTASNPDFVVQWGDGVVETITDSSVASLTHTYSSSGQYDVIITGSFGVQGFGQGNTTHIEKVTSILSWGSPFTFLSKLENFSNVSSIQATDYPIGISGLRLFAGCVNLNADLSFWKDNFGVYTGVGEEFGNCFAGCTSFNGSLSGWKVNNSTRQMFSNATSFNQDLTMWDVSNVYDMNLMFDGATAFDFNNINGWQFRDGCTATNMFDNRYTIGTYTQAEIAKVADLWESFDFPTQGENVDATSFMRGSGGVFTNMILPKGSFPDADIAINNLVAKGWTDISPITQPTLKLLLDTSLGGNTVTFPSTIGNNRIIDWGDGTWERIVNTADPSHTYSSTGQYTCTMAVGFGSFRFQGQFAPYTGVSQLIEVTDTEGLTSSGSGSSFGGCTNLTFISDEFLSVTTDLSDLVYGCTSFNQDISGWDVSGVTDMNAMFQDATLFNQDISGWQVGGVTDMSSMFRGASAFNQDISGWDVSAANTLGLMFFTATSFDQNLGPWQFKNSANVTLFLFATSISNANLANSIIGWNSNPNQGVGVNWDNLTSGKTLSESATVAVDGYDGAAGKSAYDNIILATGSGGLGWTGNPNITWVA